MSSEHDQNNHHPRGSLRLAPNVYELEEHKRKLPRQFVNFTFYRALPAWRIRHDNDKQDCKRAFLDTVDNIRTQIIIHNNSTVCHRTHALLMMLHDSNILDSIN